MEMETYLESLNLKLERIEEMLRFLVKINSRKQRPLTERQKQVLELIQQGLCYEQIARVLNISRSYVVNIVVGLRKKGFEV